MRAIRLAVPFLVATLATLLGCGGSGGGTSAVPSGTLAVSFGSDSFPGYSQAVVSMEKIEASMDGSTWADLGSVKKSFNLLAVQNGSSTPALAAQSVAVGTYTKFRITWATKNYSNNAAIAAYLVPTGGENQVLTMPSTTTLTGSITVASGQSTDMLLMLNGDQAVLHTPSSETPYVFNATGKAYDLSQVGQIEGQLATADGTPLAGVEVYAETLDGYGVASLVRRALSDDSGHYALEALPGGLIYYAATLPAGYPARATSAIGVVANTSATANLTFSAAQTTGSLVLTISPASTSSQGTWGELRQSVAAGASGSSQNLIIRSQPAVTGTSVDTITFDSLVSGTYGVSAQRSTSGGTAVKNSGTQKSVTAGSIATYTIAF